MKKGSKRLTAWLLTLCMTLSVVTTMPVKAATIDPEGEDDYSYAVQNDEKAGLVIISNNVWEEEPNTESEDPDTGERQHEGKMCQSSHHGKGPW